jgi:hypothetical protein
VYRGLKDWIERLLGSIPIQAFGLTVICFIYHKYLAYVLLATPIRLGALTSYHAVPFYAMPRMNLSLWIIPASFVLLCFLMFSKKTVRQEAISSVRLILSSFLFFFAIGISVAMIDGYNEVLKMPKFLTPYLRIDLEYFGDVPLVEKFGLRSFMKDYANPVLFSQLSLHSKTHPPGGILFLWFISRIFGYNIISASIATVIFTSVTLIPVWLLAKNLYNETVGRYALLLFLITPSIVLYTTVSMDGPFSVFLVLAVFFFFKALSDSGKLYHILSGFSLAFGTMMTYSAVVICIFFIITALLILIVDRNRFKQVLILLMMNGGILILFYWTVYFITGFNIFDALWTSYFDEANREGTGYETLHRYVHLSGVNVSAFLIWAGIPTVVLWIRQIVKSISQALRSSYVDIFTLSSFITVFLVSFSTLYATETERIWIFMIPFIVIPAAKYIHDLCSRRYSHKDFFWVSALLCIQILSFEILLVTFW